jgi:hypothetical protein
VFNLAHDCNLPGSPTSQSQRVVAANKSLFDCTLWPVSKQGEVGSSNSAGEHAAQFPTRVHVACSNNGHGKGARHGRDKSCGAIISNFKQNAIKLRNSTLPAA